MPLSPGIAIICGAMHKEIKEKTPLKTYTKDEIAAKLRDHANWSLGEDGMLHADFTFGNFKEVMMFTNAIALLAEAADHHPDLNIHAYKKLSVSLMTHSEDAITDKDFALVAQIDDLPRFK